MKSIKILLFILFGVSLNSCYLAVNFGDEDGNGNITLSEILELVDENEPDAIRMTTFYTNIFNNNDFDSNEMLDEDEFLELKIA